jgi:hypothetical protein
VFKLKKFLAASLIIAALLPVKSIAAGPTICAGNIPPDGMVITATGTSDSCPRLCRARDTQPAQLSITVICAGQAIPDGYELENLTSVPACDGVGAQDNAYVIRETDEFLSSQ